jgi:hypothetical protein
MVQAELQSCDLCALPVKITGFVLNTPAGPKSFCCEGCKAIYNLQHGTALLQNSSDNRLNANIADASP